MAYKEEIKTILGEMQGCTERGIHLMASGFDDAVFTSYHDLGKLIEIQIGELKNNGVVAGEHILFPFETSINHITTFFALMAVGAVPLSIAPSSVNPNQKEYRLYLSRLKRRFRSNRIFLPEKQKLALPEGITALSLEPGRAQPIVAGISHVMADPVNLAFVQFSSGSTSFPKGVPITHDKLWRHVNKIACFDQRKCSDNGASWLPLYHDMGLIGGLLSCVVKQNNIYLATPKVFLFDPMGWLELLSDKKITVFPTPNFALEYILKVCPDLDELKHLDLSNLNHIYVGSEPVNPESLKAFVSQFKMVGLDERAIDICYGMAEAVLMTTGSHQCGFKTYTDDLGVEYVSVGRPLEGIEIVLDTSDFPDSHLGAGEVLIKGGDLAEIYYGATEPMIDSCGFYQSGDVGFMRHGELYIVGRLGDRLKINGQSLFAVDLERIVDECGVFKKGNFAVVQDEQTIHVIGVPQSLRALEPQYRCRENIRQAIADVYGISIEPAHIHFVRKQSIEKTSSGKLKRHHILGLLKTEKLAYTTLTTHNIDKLRRYWQLFRVKMAA